MQELDLASEILIDISGNDVEFAEALRKKFQADVSIRPLRSNVAGLVGCELRHHLLFTFLLNPLAPDWTAEEKSYAALVLANEYFFKRYKSEDIKAALKLKLGDAKFALLAPLFEKSGKPEEYIPATVARNSDQYLSLRYNTPEWVLKIWEHYGYGATYRILRKNIRPLVSSLRVRTDLLKTEDLVKNPDFKPTPVSDLVTYVGKTPLRRLDEVKQGKLFLEKAALKKVLDEFKIKEPCEALCFNGNADDAILKEFIVSYGSSVGLNLGVYNVDKYVEVSKLIKSLNLHNINFYSAEDPLAMDAAISRPQDLVVACPNSSNFDLIREYPDYLMHFKKDGMDSLFAKEKACLEGCSKYVAEGGTLIYMIFTISRKEGHQTLAEFVEHHSEFKLVSESQLFPYEDLDTAMYYAVLKKEPKLAKVTPPLADLAKASVPQVAVSAEGAAAK
ncbi:MAG: 16S rRNA methyltransferase B [Tenericutes bacterium ADurb.BinA155]|jgi:16S rRNA C967 or C1407 C5-methylase (RsmB/RsmF family)|nr:MAG: 16S rRNA methyltransferase B [Tenericutes bacterium ADurb.BinA155]